MELVQVGNKKRGITNGLPVEINRKYDMVEEVIQTPSEKPFILANTESSSLELLRSDCVIPVFSKDNARTISHQEFVECAFESATKVFSNQKINEPSIRVSHEVKGRIPEAIHKKSNELLEHEITKYWERMAFVIKLPNVYQFIGNNKLCLTIGGIRSYSLENLHGKKNLEKFKIFIGFQNQICMNLCVWSDGFVQEVRIGSMEDLQQAIIRMIVSYNAESHLGLMRELPNFSLSEKQFAQLVGRLRLYNFLSKEERDKLPVIQMNDGHINTITKNYYQDESFCRDENGKINLWKLYNLMTSANKSSYIDTFLDRGANSFQFINGLKDAINGNSDYSWFLS